VRAFEQNAKLAAALWGDSPAGFFGYSHLLGGYAGGQAEYVRVPFADVGTIKVPDSPTDEQVLFLSDIFPTGHMAAETCDIERGDTVAIWGCGPVGQFAIRSALMLGAGRVIAIDRVPERLALARAGGAKTIDYTTVDNMREALAERTLGRGPDSCIDAVGMEPHAPGSEGVIDASPRAPRRIARLRHVPAQARRLHQGRHDPLIELRSVSLMTTHHDDRRLAAAQRRISYERAFLRAR